LGRFRTILQDKHEHSRELERTRTTTVPYSTSGTIGKMDITPGNQILPASDSDKHDVKIREEKIQSDVDRNLRDQKSFSEDSTGQRLNKLSHPTR
jgi:hypothetical protein